MQGAEFHLPRNLLRFGADIPLRKLREARRYADPFNNMSDRARVNDDLGNAIDRQCSLNRCVVQCGRYERVQSDIGGHQLKSLPYVN